MECAHTKGAFEESWEFPLTEGEIIIIHEIEFLKVFVQDK